MSKKSSKKKRSRYIPKAVEKKVKSRHFFQCAWCGTGIMEQHHIKEFAEGGEHVEGNLILLCSNCHTEVHKPDTKIKLDDLLLRKSTHLKGDRIGGNVQFDIQTPKIKFGSIFVVDANPFLSFKREPVIELEYINDAYSLSCRFYNKTGELIFWMSKNRYWCPASFEIIQSAKSIEIKAKNQNYKLHIWQTDDYLNLLGENYSRGNKISLTNEGLFVNNTSHPFNMQFRGNGTIVMQNKGGFMNI